MPELENWQYELFCREYLNCNGNAALAAFNAGFAPDNNYDDRAPSRGSKLLDRPEILERIAALKAERLARLEVTADNLLREAARLAFYDPARFFREDGTPRDLREIDEDTRAAIVGMDVAEIYGAEPGKSIGRMRKFKLADKLGAIQLLMRQQGMITDKSLVQYDLSNLSNEELQALETIQSKLAAKP